MPATAEFRLRLQRGGLYNHVTFTPIAKDFMLYCRLIYMLSMPCVQTYDQSKGGDTGELQSRMVPSQNNWVESAMLQETIHNDDF